MDPDHIRTGFMPVPCLPNRLDILRWGTITFRAGDEIGSVALSNVVGAVLALTDVCRDIVWCYNVEAGTLVIGSAYGRHVYTVSLQAMQLASSLKIERLEDRYWNRMALLPLPNGSRILVFSDISLDLLTWSGQVVMHRTILPNTHFAALDNDSVTVRDAEGQLIRIPFLQSMRDGR